MTVVTSCVVAQLVEGGTASPLHDGILEYDGANKANVFDSNGELVHELKLVSDRGNELGGGKPQYREVLAQKLLDQGLIRDESQLMPLHQS